MKKLSKRLLAMLLVAVMVAAAIPFGAFADPFTHEGGVTHDDESNAVWALQNSIPTADGHEVYCTLCYANGGQCYIKQVPHTFNESGVCECGYAKVYYNVVVSGSVSASARTETVLSSDTTVAQAAAIDGISGLNIHEGHTGSGYIVTDKSYSGDNRTLTLTVAKDEHNLYVLPEGYTATTHVVKCQVTGCAYDTTAAHSFDPATGVCACTAVDSDHKFNYTVSIWTPGNIQLAESKTVAMTEAAAEAIKTNAKQAIEDNFLSVYNDLTVSALNGATATVDHSARTIRLVVDKQESTGTPANQILVIYDDGNTRTINRDINVGTWYFASSNLGLSNTWGTKQAILKIEDANGLRYVSWGSKDSDAYIKATDSTVWVLGNNKTVTIYYLKSSTSNPTTTNAHATKKYEFNTQLGTLPDLPAGYNAWYVDGVQLTENTVYDWESDYVYAYPGKGDGDGRVHLFIYNNNKQLMKNVDVTDNVQSNGLLTRDGLLKTIEYQTGYKNPALAGLFTESGWAYYLNNNKSTRYAQTSISVGTAGERQGTQNIYVVLTGVSGGSNADSSNPKTGDNAMLGTAAIVMALAVVGLGTVFFMKKREKI